ncbi:MAG TPA: dienelactone hydrolase family protein, partial [Chitinophagaceae bacterium]|nr:dienelactone hydrolase family protein [Chitinophagaceae bacterium]
FTGLCIVLTCACKKTDYGKASKKEAAPVLYMSLKGVTKDISANNAGYYVGLPGEYDKSTKKYPAILYVHGAGHFGNGEVDLPNLLSEGMPALLDTKKFPNEISMGAEKFSFIVLAPQFKVYPTTADIKDFLEFAKLNYRIDISRIYINGMSIGGRIACDFAAEFPTDVAALVPMAGSSNFDLDKKCQKIANEKIAVWAFHNQEDQVISVEDTKKFIAGINVYNPEVAPRLTIFVSSSALLKHDAWTKATDPGYKENGKNIYEWMLQFKK